MRKVSRIEHYPVSRRVQVHIDVKFLADSIQAIELSETGYPPRHYFPCKDVRMDLLTLSERRPAARLKARGCISL
ncbi:hypothetical protein LCGC14_0544680 [marine sediment metagenome]|uniref:DUF427 domain-containing protein n=1 Tax=marine sediment metagenome TaxID=412755 RepID=A0A0F9RRS8_9ZZZZ|nr:DUF427 domain-containing protein [Halomonas sp.]